MTGGTIMAEYSIALSNVIKKLDLEAIFLPKSAEEIEVSTNEVNRPGVEFSGFTSLFDNNRISIVGLGELGLLLSYDEEKRQTVINNYMQLQPKAVIFTRDLEIPDYFLECAEKYNVPILKSEQNTSDVYASLVQYLSDELAPRVTRHGVLVEVYGEGVLIVGDSGVGKSETAIELIKRGHRLVADDAVEIRRFNNNVLMGQSPDNIRHFIELRGIGIINARRLFGMGAIKLKKDIDIIVSLENWDPDKVYDRMGVDSEYTEILGVEVPVITVPIKPGRNTAVIVEVAAMNHRQKKMGYNAAQELLTNLGVDVSTMPIQKTKKDLSNL
jgi:HPr kinase/phosphorylase